jgi:DUF4097 and DUF4098 domain-containing protein YvlB
MKHIGFTLLGLCLVLSPLARADEWSKTFSGTGKPDLKVETSDANIRVETWDQNTIEARVTTERWTIGEGGIKIFDHQTGDAVELEVRFPHNIIGFSLGSRRVEIEIHMPRAGRVKLHTGDGSIRLSAFKGDMEIESSDGSQDIDSVDGNLRAHAGDGHIRAAGRFDGLELGTGDGRIEARALPGSKVESSWNLRAGDGSITLRVPENFAADVELRTGDGHINLEMPVAMEGRLAEKDIRGKLNGGGNRLTIHTGDGSIRLEKL